MADSKSDLFSIGNDEDYIPTRRVRKRAIPSASKPPSKKHKSSYVPETPPPKTSQDLRWDLPKCPSECLTGTNGNCENCSSSIPERKFRPLSILEKRLLLFQRNNSSSTTSSQEETQPINEFENEILHDDQNPSILHFMKTQQVPVVKRYDTRQLFKEICTFYTNWALRPHAINILFSKPNIASCLVDDQDKVRMYSLPYEVRVWLQLGIQLVELFDTELFHQNHPNLSVQEFVTHMKQFIYATNKVSLIDLCSLEKPNEVYATDS